MDFETLGEEWGGPQFADAIVDDLVAEYLGPDVDVLEIGCGGGKFSQRIAPKVRSLVCADISPAMIAQTRGELARRGVGENVSYQVLSGLDFAGVEDNSVDFIFSYDVQLHMQPQNVYSYMEDARRVLRPNGVFMLHQINLASEGGISHFLTQYNEHTWDYAFDSPARLGHIYFMSPGQMRALADAAGMKLERLVDDFPGEDSPLYPVTRGRDLIGFIRPAPSRLLDGGPSTRLMQVSGDATVWAMLADGTRAAVIGQRQFERSGFKWDAIAEVTAEELAEIPLAELPLATWE
jgi:SAM-dependent methyltransferase